MRGNPVVLIAAWVRFMGLLQPPADEAAGPVFPPDASMDEFVTVATYDKVTDAHIALGRLSAEGIEAQLFDQNMVQMDWLYSIALGGIKLRVARGDEKAARKVLETDYSKTLEDADLGKRED
jgi:hypothetical protein